MSASFTLSFHGGAGSVTGANFLLEGRGVRVLIDCGFEQGCKFCEDVNREPFAYEPASIDALIVTHAHVDHIGRIPLLVKRGFRGAIYSTEATRELAEVMFSDSLKLLAKEAREAGHPPLYGASDVAAAMALWRGVPYHHVTTLPGELVFELRDAGHILGSAMVAITHISRGTRGKTVLFTGDLGNSPAPLLRDTESVHDADYVVMESVYGNRNHESVDLRSSRLRAVIEKTIKQKGTLLLPAFSLERTQIMLYELNNLIEEKRIPAIPVFLDSPLAIAVTEIYRKRIRDFKEGIQNEIAKGDDIFSFPGLVFTETAEASRSINKVPTPKIIIAGAGMSHGGRIQLHEKRYLPDPTTTLLLVGYQAAGSMGRILQDGARTVMIDGERVPVRASVVTITGYSAHKDLDGLMEFAEGFASRAQKVFVTMGEPKAALFLVQRLRDYLNLNALAPQKGEQHHIEL